MRLYENASATIQVIVSAQGSPDATPKTSDAAGEKKASPAEAANEPAAVAEESSETDAVPDSDGENN